MCTRDSDCSNSLGSLANNRKYCCGGTFCCTLEQYNQGLTTDPFLSSTGALVGIVVGITAFCLVVGVVVWCWFTNSQKQKRIRKQRARRLEMASYQGPYTEDSLPGYSTNPRPPKALPRVPHEYDYPPESNTESPRAPGRDYRSEDPRRFDDIRWPDSERRRPYYEDRDYRHSTPARNARRDEPSSRPYKTGLVEYLPYHHTPRHPDYRNTYDREREYARKDHRYDRRH